MAASSGVAVAIIAQPMGVIIGAYFMLVALWAMLRRQWEEMRLFGLAGIVVGGTVVAIFALGYWATGLAHDQALELMLRFADMTRLDRWGVLPQLVIVSWIRDNYLIEAAPWSWAFTTMLRHFVRLDQLWLFLAGPAALLSLVAVRAALLRFRGTHLKPALAQSADANVVAVSMAWSGSSPGHAGVGLLRNMVMQPKRTQRQAVSNLIAFDATDRSSLFAHCASFSVNALYEPANRTNEGRVSSHGVRRRLEHADVLARAVGLDMVATGWTTRIDNYLGRVTKPRILEAVREARGESSAQLIDHLKKGDMAREAERLLEGTGWLPEPLRLADADVASDAATSEVEALPEFLADDDETQAESDEDQTHVVPAD